MHSLSAPSRASRIVGTRSDEPSTGLSGTRISRSHLSIFRVEDMMIAFWITFSSSRTFPGHTYARSADRASAVRIFCSRPIRPQNFLMKYSDNSRISSLLSRSGGMVSAITFRRKKRSCLNLPFSTSSLRSRLVAAIIRTSTVTGSVAPILTISDSCSTLSSLIWSASGISASSSEPFPRLPIRKVRICARALR